MRPTRHEHWLDEHIQKDQEQIAADEKMARQLEQQPELADGKGRCDPGRDSHERASAGQDASRPISQPKAASASQQGDASAADDNNERRAILIEADSLTGGEAGITGPPVSSKSHHAAFEQFRIRSQIFEIAASVVDAKKFYLKSSKRSCD